MIEGDFNSVLSNVNVTGRINYSRTIQELIRGYDRVDMWETAHGQATYTQYTSRGASRLDRIYISRNLSDQKRGVETRLAAFTDHLAVVLRITLEVTPVWRGRSYWKMNTTLPGDKNFQRQLRQKWADWTKQIKHYPKIVLWWERVVKINVRRLFIGEGTETRREETQMENLYYTCLYEARKQPI